MLKKKEEHLKLEQVAYWMQVMVGINAPVSTMKISHRKDRYARPRELCQVLSAKIPTTILDTYKDKQVSMLRVKTNDKGKYMISIMLEG